MPRGGGPGSGRRVYPRVVAPDAAPAVGQAGNTAATMRAPGMLRKRGQAEWKRLCRLLGRDGRLRPENRGALTRYCTAHEQLWRAEDMLAAEVTKEALDLWKAAQAAQAKAGQELGLHKAAPPKVQKSDPLAALQAGRPA